MSNGLFFGVEIKPSTVYSYNVSQQVEFTMATMKNAKSSCERTVIYMELNNIQFTICSLITEKLEQQVLNLKIQKGAQLKVWSKGPASIQLLGTYYMDQNTKVKQTNNNSNPLKQLSVESAPGDNNDIYYYPMTKEEHKSLVDYNSEAAVAEREEFVGKFNVVMDIFDSIENPQPILDNFLSKYNNKKRGLEDIERIFSPKKQKTTDERSSTDKKTETASNNKKEDVKNVSNAKANMNTKKQNATKKAAAKKNNNTTKKPVQNTNAKKSNTAIKTSNTPKQKPNNNNPNNNNKKKKKKNQQQQQQQTKKNPNNTQKTSTSPKKPETTDKTNGFKIDIPQ